MLVAYCHWEEWQQLPRSSIKEESILVYVEPADSLMKMQAIILMFLQEDSERNIHLLILCLMKGYPQAGATLSTAYENEDYNGDGKPDGRVYRVFYL